MKTEDEPVMTYGMLFLKYRELGVKKMLVTYAGEGDSGDLEEVYYEKEDGTPYPDRVYLPEEDESMFKQLCDKPMRNLEDWWNNDGGHGVVSIDLETGNYEIDNHIKEVHYETYSHEGNVIKKLEEEE